jgi:FtsP/CotA-like multicopper oxidase with cupredoxin domain
MNTPWADGVPGLSQRPIQPGGTYLYKWHADESGSYFYHAHSRGQIEDGANGPIIIKPQPGTLKPFAKISAADVQLLEHAESHVRPLMLSDWRHRTSDQTWNDTVTSGIDTTVCMDSVVINGKGSVDCWPRADINAAVSPAAAPFLNATGLQLTDKGYITLVCHPQST